MMLGAFVPGRDRIAETEPTSLSHSSLSLCYFEKDLLSSLYSLSFLKPCHEDADISAP